MKALTFLLSLEEPLLATQPNAGKANSAVSYSFIPGSMIRGAVIRLYQSVNKVTNLVLNEEARSLFFNGQVCFLNAYPILPGNQVRMLPAPLSWFTEKDAANDPHAFISDFSILPDPKLQKPKSPMGEFCAIVDSNAILLDPARQVDVHNASTNRNKKGSGTSQVFRYEALAKGQTLAGVILSQNEGLLNDLKSHIDGSLFLGGSHTGGYGHVSVSNVNITSSWKEYIPEKDSDPDKHLIMTLLSDLILPASGDPMLEVLMKSLEAVGTAEEVIERAYFHTRLVGGFNRKWGLPLPQAWAIKAGSVFILKPDLLSQERLCGLIETGLGERREDGFGRLAINWHLAPRRIRSPILVEETTREITLTPISQKIARKMTNQIQRARLESQLVALLAQEWKFADLPSSSQLNRVRVAARQAILTDEASVIPNHISSLRSAKKIWEKARINGKPLDQWVIRHSQLGEADFCELFQLDQGLPIIAGQSFALDQTLLREYCARLVDGVMKLASEHARAKEETTS